MQNITFDWITFAVESVGIAIFCIWIVVPIRESRAILRRVLKMGTPGESGKVEREE